MGKDEAIRSDGGENMAFHNTTALDCIFGKQQSISIECRRFPAGQSFASLVGPSRAVPLSLQGPGSG